MITLITCTDYAKKRLIVQAFRKRVGYVSRKYKYQEIYVPLYMAGDT